MSEHLDMQTRLVREVLSGQMQDRYVENGIWQMHPNYMYGHPELNTVYGDPRDTRIGVQAAYLLRWAGVSGRRINDLDESAVVPSLKTIKSESVVYAELEPAKTFDILKTMAFIDIYTGTIIPSNSSRRILVQNPKQVFTVLPPKRFLPGLTGIGDGSKALRVYNEQDFGPGVKIPLGKTTSKLSVDRRRRGFRLVEDQD